MNRAMVKGAGHANEPLGPAKTDEAKALVKNVSFIKNESRRLEDDQMPTSDPAAFLP